MAMREYLDKGEKLSYDGGWIQSGVAMDEFVVMGNEHSLVGFVLNEPSEKPNGNGQKSATVAHIGVWVGYSGDAFDEGDAVYLDGAATNGDALTNDDDSNGNYFVGHAYRDKDAGAGPVYVRINN